ncbi:vWA domain-containing protein [Streptomyces sp. NBC_00009]|uniref:vWA domain-containing protein n=1 Tax=Streptomyces sp. NBC_00009 TaxID=2975620 RepID=UPI003251278C
MTTDAGVAIDALTDPGGPYLIGVRHHAPSLAAVVPRLLDEAAPDVLLVELPAETQELLPWLAHEETVAPVALAAVLDGAAESGPAFYPFADFSPELAALRWAARNGVPVVACDLPLAERAWREPRVTRPAEQASAPAGRRLSLHDAVRGRLTGRDGDDLWDRLVEAPAPGATPQALRRAALLTGWALRRDAQDGPGVDPLDLTRERWMRARLREAARGGRRVAAVIGAFHAPALSAGAVRDEAQGEPLAGVSAGTPAESPATGPGAEPPAAQVASSAAPTCAVSLIPYTYALLDARSGYPAGIRDPEWQHQVLESAGDPAAVGETALRCAVRVTGELRAEGHPSGPADAREIRRVAGDLASLRGLPAPGRSEFAEAVQTVLAQGEPLGRGRAVARALERVLVGERTGRPAPGAPRGGLAPAVEAELAALGLPGPASGGQDKELRLDPLRSDPDRKREVLLRRLALCGIPYAQETSVGGAGGADALTTRWTVRWTPATAAVLTTATTRGVTPAQVAEGVLRARVRAAHAEGGPTAAQALTTLGEAAECALPALAGEALAEVTTVLPAIGTLPELLTGLDLTDRLTSGHIAGLTMTDPVTDPAADPTAAPTPWLQALADCADLLTVAAVRSLDGLAGSEDPDDARALVELARRADVFGGMRLADSLARLADSGTPLMRGAAAAVRVLLGHTPATALGARAASWVDTATDPGTRAELTARLTGLLTAAGSLLETAPEALAPLLDRVGELPDSPFLERLPALRGGFDTLSPAARDRLLTVIEERIDGTLDADLPPDTDARTLAAWTTADLAAREALAALGLLPTAPDTSDRPHLTSPSAPTPTPAPVPVPVPPTGDARIAPAERWRLVLGRRGDQLPQGFAPLATALDELYGKGRGEGARGDLPGGAGGRGGREAPYPGVREWAEELTALFGPGIREEVLAAAATRGRTDVVSALDPEAVRPSVELLRTVLQHAGGLPEAKLAALRPLVRRLVDELTRTLATRLRPALTGAATARPTRRPGGRLDLARTLRANLATARRTGDGRIHVIPERPVFHGRSQRSADWRLIILTDVSGSMEASTIWSALTASVLAGVPALSTHFLAFSTTVLDLTEHVHDPLALLLEARVGGGTHIAAGLRHARTLVTVPSRTLVVVVSDFEEGYPVGGMLAEVRELVGAGCHVLGCASLDDAGRPRYSTGIAGQLVAAGMPVAALSPLELARWVGEKIR